MSDRPAFGAHVLNDLQTRELRQARVLLVIIGIINMVWQGLRYSALSLDSAAIHASHRPDLIAQFDKAQRMSAIGIALGVAYAICGLLVYSKPVASTATALWLYVGALVVQLVADPSALWSDVLGTGIRIAVLIGLVSAVQFARIYERNRRSELPKASLVSR